VILLVAFLWGWAEATVFFIVPDVLLTLIALRSLRTALIAGVFATFGAIVGGAMAFDYANLHPASSREIVESIPGISDRMVGEVGTQIERHGASAVFLGPLRGIPYKIYAVQWAWQHRPLMTFLLASVPARAIRFVLTSVLAAMIAAPLRRRVRERTLITIHVVAWTAFYTVYFTAHASAQTTIPSTPAGAAMTRFLESYNGWKLAGDNVWGPQVCGVRPLRFQAVVTSPPHDLRVWTKSEVTDTWLSLRRSISSSHTRPACARAVYGREAPLESAGSEAPDFAPGTGVATATKRFSSSARSWRKRAARAGTTTSRITSSRRPA